MRFYEYEAKKIFDMMGIPTPKQYGVIHSPEELDELDITFPAMLKAMVLTGGRGKAGGIKKAKSIEEAKKYAKELLSLAIKGYPVKALLVEEAVGSTGACYIGATMDPVTFKNVVIVSASGGVEIETVAKEKPEAIHKYEIDDNAMELPEDVAKDLASLIAQELNTPHLEEKLADVISKVYATYQSYDSKVCEINPLLVTEDEVIAADAKIVLDDNALYRHSDVLNLFNITGKRHDIAEATKNEKRAQKAGFPYVDLLPEGTKKEKDKLYVGLVPGGAGYGIFSIDEVANIGEKFFGGKVVPVNFMDSGGGPSQKRVAEMFHLLMDYDLVDIIITSRFGGISSCDVFIRGLIQAVRERKKNGQRVVPVWGRMVGTDLPNAKDFLAKAKAETPEILKDVNIIVGNQKIMADVIKEGISKAFEARGWKI